MPRTMVLSALLETVLLLTNNRALLNSRVARPGTKRKLEKWENQRTTKRGLRGYVKTGHAKHPAVAISSLENSRLRVILTQELPK